MNLVGRILKVKTCWECPLNRSANGIDYCNHKRYNKQCGRIFKETDDQSTFPVWCPLKEEKKNNVLKN